MTISKGDSRKEKKMMVIKKKKQGLKTRKKYENIMGLFFTQLNFR